MPLEKSRKNFLSGKRPTVNRTFKILFCIALLMSLTGVFFISYAKAEMGMLLSDSLTFASYIGSFIFWKSLAINMFGTLLMQGSNFYIYKVVPDFAFVLAVNAFLGYAGSVMFKYFTCETITRGEGKAIIILLGAVVLIYFAKRDVAPWLKQTCIR